MLQFETARVEKKKPRKAVAHTNDHGKTTSAQWIEKYSPREIKELCLHHTKVKAVEKWLEAALEHEETYRGNSDYCPMVLVLCGRPGNGKSTAIRVIASKHSVVIDHLETCEKDGYASFDGAVEESIRNTVYGTLSVSSGKFAEEIRSDERRGIDIDAEIEDDLWNSPLIPFSLAQQPHSPTTNTNRRIYLIDDFYDTKDKLLSQRIENQRTYLLRLVRAVRSPCVLILSDVEGKDSFVHSVEKIFPHSSVVRELVEVVFVPPVTLRNTSKVLSNIIGSERLSKFIQPQMIDNLAEASAGDLRHAIIQLQFFCSGRGINIALANQNTLKARNMKKRSLECDSLDPVRLDIETSKTVNGEKDQYYPSLYSVGKLCHATLDLSGRLQFDPDGVFERSLLDTDILLEFLQWNSIDFINNTQLRVELAKLRTYPSLVQAPSSSSQESHQNPEPVGCDESIGLVSPIESCLMALNAFSEVDILQSRRFDANSNLDRSSVCFPDEYVSALSSRAIPISKGLGLREILEGGQQEKRSAKRYEESMDESSGKFNSYKMQVVHKPGLPDLRIRSKDAKCRFEQLGYILSRGRDIAVSDSLALYSRLDIATCVVPMLRNIHCGSSSNRNIDYGDSFLSMSELTRLLYRGEEKALYSASSNSKGNLEMTCVDIGENISEFEND